MNHNFKYWTYKAESYSYSQCWSYAYSKAQSCSWSSESLVCRQADSWVNPESY